MALEKADLFFNPLLFKSIPPFGFNIQQLAITCNDLVALATTFKMHYNEYGREG
jgi:hypothetical protein